VDGLRAILHTGITFIRQHWDGARRIPWQINVLEEIALPRCALSKSHMRCKTFRKTRPREFFFAILPNQSTFRTLPRALFEDFFQGKSFFLALSKKSSTFFSCSKSNDPSGEFSTVVVRWHLP